MAYIGTKPADEPLTSADITDGIIVNADIANSTINLTTKVTGTLPLTNGGTGLATLGTAAQELRVNSGATALEYYTPTVASSDYVKLATSTITANTTAVTFDGYFSSTYDTYIIYGNNIYTDANAGFEFYLRQSAANLTANTYFYSGYDVNSANSSQVHYGHPNNKINMNRVTTATGANSKQSFQFMLFDPNNNQGSHHAEYYSNIYYIRNDGYLANTYLSGDYTDVSTAITGFQIKPNSGNFDSGSIVLYGVKK
jgi:hypothetical protein